MANRTYKSARGKNINMNAVMLQNEKVRSVGNMNVNARGDIIGPSGQIVTTKASVMQKYYEQPKGRASDTPIRRVARTPQRPPIPKAAVVQSQTINPQPQPRTTPKPKVEKKGIDAALDGIE